MERSGNSCFFRKRDIKSWWLIPWGRSLVIWHVCSGCCYFWTFLFKDLSKCTLSYHGRKHQREYSNHSTNMDLPLQWLEQRVWIAEWDEVRSVVRSCRAVCTESSHIIMASCKYTELQVTVALYRVQVAVYRAAVYHLNSISHPANQTQLFPYKQLTSGTTS